MADTEKEPIELTIKKIDIAWKMTEKAIATSNAPYSQRQWNDLVKRMQVAYATISEIVDGEATERAPGVGGVKAE